MLNASTAFIDALQSNNRLWKIKITIQRNEANSPQIDISDRVSQASVTHDFERRNSTLQLELDNYDYSLSPMNRDSATNNVGGVYDPLLDSRHIVRVWEGITTINGVEYVQKFTGLIGDDVDADSFPGSISLNCRDYSKYFQDTYIYQSKTYSGVYTDGSGTKNLSVVEYIIQDLINQFVPNLNIVLNVANNTNYVVGRPDKPYTAKNTNLWDACQLLADTSSHELRFLEDGTLTLRKIERDFSNMTVSDSFDESQIIKDKMSLSDADIRNHIMLRVQGLDPVEKKNQDSINKYGRRYMEVHRGMSNIVSTAEQAHALCANLIRDLSWVNPVDRVELPLYPITQVGDIISLTNNKLGTDPLYDKFKVVRVQDTFSPKNKRTQLHLQGHTRFTPDNSIAPHPPSGLAHEFIEREIQNYEGSGWTGNSKTISYPMIKWTPPTTDISGNALTSDFGGYSIYRREGDSTQTGNVWYPISSVKSRIESLNLTVNYFYDYTAGDGYKTYKIVAVDKMGSTSSESETMTVNVPAIIYT